MAAKASEEDSLILQLVRDLDFRARDPINLMTDPDSPNFLEATMDE